jgi:hypothetical protein
LDSDIPSANVTDETTISLSHRGKLAYWLGYSR